MTTPRPAAAALARLRRYTWAFLVPLPSVCVLVTVIQLSRSRSSVTDSLLVVFAFTVAAAICTWSLHTEIVEATEDVTSFRSPGRFVVAVGALLVALIATVPPMSIAIGWIMMTGTLIATMLIRSPTRWRFPGLGVLAGSAVAVAALLAWWERIPIASVTTFAIALLSVTTTLWLQWWNFDVARRLERSRRVAAELAVAEERLRFAAELHDIQGHHLQVIALKSELAVRLSPARPDDATDQMRQVQSLAIEALSDTRAVVAGYRRVSLRTEITNATRVLTAAGIHARANLPDTEFTERSDSDHLLGLLVREATTNILRHAHARYAHFELTRTADSVDIRIGNDGVPSPAPGADGTGLTALRERFDAADGTLQWRIGDAEFSVSATLPSTSHSPDTATRAGGNS